MPSALGGYANMLPHVVMTVVLVSLSASLHEFGHAYAAYKCGDTTAKDAGRLTPNPLAHIDPFGSVMLPLLLSLSSGAYIAYAKPVPYNPNRLAGGRRDEAIVALAGPVMNLLQAIVGAAVVRLLIQFAPQLLRETMVSDVLLRYVMVNISLMIFNLLPVPPLDGSKLVLPLLKGSAYERYHSLQRHALPILLVVLYVIPEFTGFDPVGEIIGGLGSRIFYLLMGIS